jgi:hypothetical protein
MAMSIMFIYKKMQMKEDIMMIVIKMGRVVHVTIASGGYTIHGGTSCVISSGFIPTYHCCVGPCGGHLLCVGCCRLAIMFRASGK